MKEIRIIEKNQGPAYVTGPVILQERWPDVLNYVVPEARDGEELWVAISWNELVDRTVPHLLGRLKGDRPPQGDILADYYTRAQKVPPAVWQMLQINCNPKNLDPNFRSIRAFALETLRLWFSEHLNRMTNWELNLHITAPDLSYKQ